jgi:hypothetical protein
MSTLGDGVHFTRILILPHDRTELLCWRRRLVLADGTTYEGSEVAAPLEACLPWFTEEERAIVRALPRVDEGET